MTDLKTSSSAVRGLIWAAGLCACVAQLGCGRTVYSSSPLIRDWKIQNQCEAMNLWNGALSGKGSTQVDDINGLYKSSYDFVAPMYEKQSTDELARHFAHGLRMTPGLVVRDVMVEKSRFSIAYAFSGEQGTNHGTVDVNVYLPTRPGNEVRFVTQFTEIAEK
jgi:hypothetical protein